MELYSIDWSPWVRKVRIAAIERGIDSSVELITANIGFEDKTLKRFIEADHSSDLTNKMLILINSAGWIINLL